MSSPRDLARQHAVLCYYALTFALSWGAVLAMMARTGIPKTAEDLAPILPVAIAAMLAGPSVAGIALTALLDGRQGLRRVWEAIVRVRLGLRWYALAILLAPLLSTSLLLAFRLLWPNSVSGALDGPYMLSRTGLGLTAGACVGVLEELGWTGFATPRLMPRHGVLATGVIVGVLWGAWHILAQVGLASGSYSGSLPLPVFLISRSLALLVGPLPASRVLMTWAYSRTNSLGLIMLMHASLTASTLILEPRSIAGTALLAYDAATGLAWWIAVGVLVLSRRRRQAIA